MPFLETGEGTHRHRGKGSVKTGQRRAARPHDGERLESAEAGRGEDKVSPGAFRGHAQNSGPQNGKRMHFLLSEAIKLVEICSAASGLVLPRAADQGSVRAGWQLLGCKTKAGPLIMGTSEETLNEALSQLPALPANPPYSPHLLRSQSQASRTRGWGT